MNHAPKPKGWYVRLVVPPQERPGTAGPEQLDRYVRLDTQSQRDVEAVDTWFRKAPPKLESALSAEGAAKVTSPPGRRLLKAGTGSTFQRPTLGSQLAGYRAAESILAATENTQGVTKKESSMKGKCGSRMLAKLEPLPVW